MEFEWDESKRQKTLFERGIDFIDAALVWDDPLRQVKKGYQKQLWRTSLPNNRKGPCWDIICRLYC